MFWGENLPLEFTGVPYGVCWHMRESKRAEQGGVCRRSGSQVEGLTNMECSDTQIAIIDRTIFPNRVSTGARCMGVAVQGSHANIRVAARGRMCKACLATFGLLATFG